MTPSKPVTSLPQHLLVVYHRYKHDTEVIAGWLAKYAARAGYKPRRSHGESHKSAARKDKKFGGKTYKHTVQLTELMDMAECIAEYKPRIKLSEWMQKVFVRTIEARQKCNSYFTTNFKADVVNNDKHRHFACLLEKILVILKPCLSVPKGRDQGDTLPVPHTPEIDSGHEKTTNNIYDHLDYEDALSQEYAEESEAAQQTYEKKEHLVPVEIELDESEIEAEFVFAIWAFLKELRAIRTMIQASWLQYFKGNMELMQAGLVTNTAIDLVRRAEAEFDVALKRPNKYPASEYPVSDLPLIIFYEHLEKTNRGPMECDASHADAVIICGCDICELTMYIPFKTSQFYVRMIEGKKIQEVVPGNEQIGVPSMPGISNIVGGEFYNSANPSQVATDRMKEILPDLISGAILHKNHFMEDEILHAARHIYHKGSIPLWTSFAFSVQLGLQDIQEVFAKSPIKDLQSAVKEVRLRHTLHCNYTNQAGVKLWDRDEEYEEFINDFEKWTIKNELGLMRSKQQPLKRFYVTIATMKLQLYLEMHLFGMSLTRHTNQVMVMAHLYNASRITDPDLPTWPDMELFITTQGSEHVFVGGRPTDINEAHKKLLLACGVSIRKFASDADQRTKHLPLKPGNFRIVKATAIAENLVSRMVGAETRRVDECAHELQELLLDSKYVNSIKRLMWLTGSQKKEAYTFGRVKALGTAAVGTFVGLHRAFSVEAPAFTLDYFALDRRCRDLTAEILQKAEAATDEYSSFQRLDIETHDMAIPIAVRILENAVRSEHAAAILRMRNKTSRANGPAMEKLFLSLLPKNFTAEEQKYLVDVANRIKHDGFLAAASEFFITEKGELAANALLPVNRAIKTMYQKKESDLEIKVLKKLKGHTTYGGYLFSENAMRSLYGPDREKEWLPLITETCANEMMKDKDPMSRENIMQLMAFLETASIVRNLNESKNLDRKEFLEMSIEKFNEKAKAAKQKGRARELLMVEKRRKENQDGLGSWFS